MAADTTPPVTIAHAVYALHTASILIGLSSAAFIVTAFVFGLPSMVAVILNYMYRDEARGTFLESHFRWQIRSFWFALLWIVIAVAIGLTIIGLPIAWAIAVGTGLWLIYRIARGWLLLKERKPAPLTSA
ncbi:MAG: hypothetical protein K2X67_22000 [Burkholderiales bacterium]|jgi:uncharacterized membrane protein|nr:hypothetical protein [Burkholderiales bacterium]